MTTTSIEWTRNPDGTEGKTWNPTRGCSLASDECENCYAQSIARRFSGPGQPFEGLINRHGKWNGVMRQAPEKTLYEPLSWKKPTRVFVNSMTDLFHENVEDWWIDQIFAVMALCPQHEFIILTKRAERMQRYMTHWPDGAARFHHVAYYAERMRPDLPKGLPDGWRWQLQKRWPLPNVILGVSVGRREFVSRIDHLRNTPAAVRMVSFEPLLEDLAEVDLSGISWGVIGGESGPGARRCDITWIRNLVRQCWASGVAPFVKQLGRVVTWDGCSQPGQHWPEGTRKVDGGRGYWEMELMDRKGADPDEWPKDLRVQRFPKVQS